MTIMVVAHRSRLRKLLDILLERYPEDIVIPIDDGLSAVQYAYNNPVDLIYACLEVPPINCFTLSQLVHKKCPQVELYLIADTKVYLSDAERAHFKGYYLAPLTVESLKSQNLIMGNG